MSPVLFYTLNSCAFGSMVTLEWLARPYRLCRIEKADHESPTYQRLNPLGEVPALLLDDGSVLTESVAILHHLGASNLAAGLVDVQGTPTFDRLNQVLAYLTTSFHPAFAPIFHTDRFVEDPALEDTVRRAAIKRLHPRYARMEALLTDREWLVGDRPTVADAYFCGIVRWGDAFLDVNAQYPRIGRLRQAMAADPAVQFAHAIEAGDAAASAGGYEGHVEVAALAVGMPAGSPLAS